MKRNLNFLLLATASLAVPAMQPANATSSTTGGSGR